MNFLLKGIFIAYDEKNITMRYLLLIFLFTTLFISCKKDDTIDGTTAAYINIAAGSTWTYEETNNDTGTPGTSTYTVTSTDKDTSINGRNYHIYDNSRGNRWYLNNNNGEYYQFDSLPGLLGGGVFERLYLKSNIEAGSNWVQSINVTVPNVPLPVPVTITNNIVEKGMSRTVNSVAYNNVIHVSTAISSALIPASAITTSINSYYAQGVGLIENSTQISINYLGIEQEVNLQTRLLSSTLK